MLRVLSCVSGRLVPYEVEVDTAHVTRVGLRVSVELPVLRFAYRLDGDWVPLPVELDATILSDEHAATFVDGEPAAWGFTGAFLGLWVQDLGGDGAYADFDHATYHEH